MHYLVYVAILAYFLYDTVTVIIQNGFPFSITQWFLCLLCVAYVVLAVILIRLAIAEAKKKKAAEEQQKTDNEGA